MYLVLSFSYKTCEIAAREKLSFSKEAQEQILAEIARASAIEEAILLCTCNRTELIAEVKDLSAAREFLFETLARTAGLGRADLESAAQIFAGKDAVKHVLSVASSLESVVVGEAQITGQLKEAFRLAKEKNVCFDKLGMLIDHAFKCAASVRNSTEIGKKSVSVASSAVAKARKILGGDLKGKKALIYGAGEMAVLCAKHLAHYKADVVMIGRDYEKTKQLAADFSLSVLVQSSSELARYLNSCEIFFSATGAPHTVITADLVRQTSFKRYWFDIAVPRDIEKIADENIVIYTVDDLREIVQTNLDLRSKEAFKAREIICDLTDDFFEKLRLQNADPVIAAIKQKARRIAHEEALRAVKKSFIPKTYEKNLELAIEKAFNKFLHEPVVFVKQNINKPHGAETLGGLIKSLS